jgi:hypothetical protein
MTSQIKTINLYGRDGIAIYLNADHDICNDAPQEAVVKVIGHSLYATSIEQAEASIRAAYLERIGDAGTLKEEGL